MFLEKLKGSSPKHNEITGSQTGETATTFVNLEKFLKGDISKSKKKQNISIEPPINNDIQNLEENRVNISIVEEISENKIIDKITFTEETTSLSNTDIDLIKKALNNNFLFTELSPSIIDEISPQLVIFSINTGDILYKEGIDGYFFFIIKSGMFKSFSSGSSRNEIILSQGDTFGEDALLNMSVRANTVQCIESGELFLLDAKTFRNTVYTLNKVDYQERIHFLRLIPMFKWMDRNDMSNLSECLIKCEYNEKKVIARKDTKSEAIIIVLEGSIKCINPENEELICEVKQQEYIGESFLILDLNWPFDLIIDNKVKCYQILKSDIIKYVGDEYKGKFIKAICKEAFNKTKLFQHLLSNVDNIFFRIVNSLNTKIYQPESLIFASDKINHQAEKSLIIIMNGNVYFVSNKKEKIAGKGEILSEDFLLGKKVKMDGYIMSGNQIVITKQVKLSYVVSMLNNSINKAKNSSSNSIINANNFTNFLDNQNDISKYLDFYERIVNLKKIQIFKNISDTRLLQIGKMMTKKQYSKGETIIEEKIEGNYLYFLYKGKVHILNSFGKKLREYRDTVCFGEISLLTNKPTTAKVIAVEDAYTYLLSKKDFELILDNNMLSYLTNKIKLLDNFSLGLTDLYYVAKLGEGKFGHVSLVHDGNNLYSIKAVNKILARKKKMLTKYFIKERTILLSIDHPLIVKLVKTFQNSDYIFYLNEYVRGVDMGNYLNQRQSNNLRNITETQFYFASILLIVNYLHNKLIAHRDIKAENIMIDESGYIKLIDFNTCTEIKDLTATITGTPHYMAPELLLGNGYSFSVDYWSIGILAFIIFYGYFPFGNGMIEPMDVYHEIIKKELVIPYNSNHAFKSILRRILNKDPRERLCNFESAKNEKFFDDFHWDELVDLSLPGPFIPEPKFITEDCISKKGTKYIDMLSTLEMESLSMSLLKDCKESTSLVNSKWAEEF